MLKLIIRKTIGVSMFDVCEFTKRKDVAFVGVEFQEPIFRPFFEFFYITLDDERISDRIDLLENLPVICEK